MLRCACYPLEEFCRQELQLTGVSAYSKLSQCAVELQERKAQSFLVDLHRIHMAIREMIKMLEDVAFGDLIDQERQQQFERWKCMEYLDILFQHNQKPTAVQQAVAMITACTYERVQGWLLQFGYIRWSNLSSGAPWDVNPATVELSRQAAVQFAKLVQEIEAKRGHLPA